MTRERRRGIVRRRRTAIGAILVAGISFLAGMTDAVGLLHLGSFVSFMSGNTTQAAVALARGNLGHAALLLGGLAVFVAGNALGIIIAHGATRRTFRVLTAVTVLLAGAALLTAQDHAIVQFYLIILAMGVINTAVEHIEGLPIGLTYVTGGLSRFGRGLGRMLVGQRHPGWLIQSVPWLGMAIGAVCGALLEIHFAAASLWMTCSLSALLAAAAFFIPPRLQRRMAHAHVHVPARKIAQPGM
ncbi:YoaK family protein [Pararhizobium antarcticum]|uniref:DUF1275 family protein n=1 Tax=Pararhizobium antarcticum TaxID=1798805 RepID=A0A657LUN6_9HYPH|nr:YoaK family protein [Pararhizobium antarcticum]OJF92076.1 hypothetical protein AX761_21580 [Rhizobium sp. 58]OJF97870.1 hypothetical protein AX760_15495 [Pararhizobium antarcticum]